MNRLPVGPKVTGKLLEQSLPTLARNPGTFCNETHGHGMKQFMFALVLQNGDLNPRMGYMERLVFGAVEYFGIKRAEDENISFSISHHCFQRFLERLYLNSLYPVVPTELFSKRTLSRQELMLVRRIFFAQIDCLPIISSTFFYLELRVPMIEMGEQSLGAKQSVLSHM